MNWSVIIIDDEPLARQRLRRLLEPYEEIVVVAEAGNALEGIEIIDALKPELIFLDVEMPELSGFEMLPKLSHQPKVVFTTAFDHYAVKAFEEDSIDYLLKPIEKVRLEKTIRKLHQNLPVPSLPLNALSFTEHQKHAIKSLTVKIGERVILVRLTDIVNIEAQDKYVFLITLDGKKHLTDYTITGLEQKLPEQFIRINRGAIINSEFIKEIRKGFYGTRVFVMNNSPESRVTSSRSYSEMIRKQFGI